MHARTRTAALTGVALTLVVVVTACASPTAEVGEPTPSSPAAEAPAAAEPEPAAEASRVRLSGEFAMSGYTYTFSIEAPTIEVESDILDAAPGSVNIHLVFSASGTLTNTTPGRNAPVPGMADADFVLGRGLLLGEMWRRGSGSAECRVPYDGLYDVAEEYCSGSRNARLYPADGVTVQLSPGESVDIAVSTSGFLGDFSIPEGTFDDFVASVESPLGWWVAAIGSETRTNCRFDVGFGISGPVLATSPDIGCVG